VYRIHHVSGMTAAEWTCWCRNTWQWRCKAIQDQWTQFSSSQSTGYWQQLNASGM